MKAIVQETGLNPVTIRTWERRYGIPQPGRSDGGHRQYTQRDLDTFKWLIARQHEGLSVRNAAERWHSLIDEGVDPLTAKEETVVEQSLNPLSFEPNAQLDDLRDEWVSACLAFNTKRAEQILTKAFSYFPAENVCIQLLLGGIAQIGEGWYRGEIKIQEEHFATALAARRLEVLIAAMPPPLRNKRIMIFCAPNDHHTLGPLLLTFMLLRRGWDVLYLGANVPIESLNETVVQVKPALIVVSAQRLHSAANLLDVVNTLHEHEAVVGYGGRIFNQLPELQSQIPGYFLGESLEIAIGNIESILTAREKPYLPQTDKRDASYDQALKQFTSRRTLIEAHVWGLFIANQKPVDDLMQINTEIANTIMAALRLGNIELLGKNKEWIEELLVSYRPSRDYIDAFILAYHQAAQIHLSDSGNMITSWLAEISSQ